MLRCYRNLIIVQIVPTSGKHAIITLAVLPSQVWQLTLNHLTLNHLATYKHCDSGSGILLVPDKEQIKVILLVPLGQTLLLSSTHHLKTDLILLFHFQK